MRILTLSAPLLLLATVPAQDKATTAAVKTAPFRFVPDDATVVARIAAPAKWRELFAATHFPKLLASDTVAPWLAELRKGFDAQMEEVRGEGVIDVDLVQKLVSEYRGEIVVAITLDASALAAHKGDGPPPFVGSVTLTPDGNFDLGALAANIAKAAEDDGGRPLRDVTIGDHKLRMTDDSLDTDGTLPVVIDGHLVFLFGHDLEKAGGRVFDTTNRMPPAGDDHGFWARANLEPVLGALMTKIGDLAQDEGAPFDIVPLLRGLGLGAIEDVTLGIRAAGKHGQMEMTVGTGERDRGLIDVLPADPAGVKLLGRLPAGGEAFNMMAVDFGALFAVIAKTWQGLGDEVPLRWDDAMAMSTDALKVRLKEDVIDHLGRGVILLGDISGDVDPDAADAPMGCLVVSLRDGKAFNTSLEQMLRARGMHAARKSEDYQGEKIHLLRVAGLFELEYAVTADMLVVALGRGEGSRAQLRGVLDAARQSTPNELPKAVTEHLAVLPPGWVGLGVTPMGDYLTNMSAMFTALLAEQDAVPDGVAVLFKGMGDLGKELVRLGMGTMVGTTYVEPRRIRMLSQW